MSLSSKFHTTARGTRIHYEQGGHPGGRLLIGLHGLGGSSDTFTPLLPYLPVQCGFHVVLVDFQGFGKTPLASTSEPLSVAGHVADLHDLIASLQAAAGTAEGQGKAIILGHSLGAIVALHYAAEYPDDVSGLCLFGAGRSAANIPAVRHRMLDLAANVRANGIGPAADTAAISNFPRDDIRPVAPEYRRAVREAVAASDPEGYAKTCEAIVDPSHVDPDYSKITCPTVFVAGDLDAISPPQRSEDLSKLVGGFSKVIIVRSGHQMILEDTQAVAEAVSELMEKAASKSA